MKRVIFLIIVSLSAICVYSQAESAILNQVDLYVLETGDLYESAYMEFEYDGNLEKLQKLVSSAHNIDTFETDQGTGKSFYIWRKISQPYWIYADYDVIFEVSESKDHNHLIRIIHNYSSIKTEWSLSSRLLKTMPDRLKIFYQRLVDQALNRLEYN